MEVTKREILDTGHFLEVNILMGEANLCPAWLFYHKDKLFVLEVYFDNFSSQQRLLLTC